MTLANSSLTNELRKMLAYKQLMNEDFFIYEDSAFEGTEDEARDQANGEAEDFLQWCKDNLVEIEELNGDTFGDYLILTDEEADEKWDESLESYIDDCILPVIPERDRSYFDNEAWKKDARMDGRGHSLSSYDGNENEETVEGVTIFLYRQ